MKELLTVLTRKGQVTIPAEIRRSLRLKQGDKVAFVIEGDRVQLARAGSVVNMTKGLLKTKAKPLTAEQLREAGEKAIAQEALERGRP